MSDTQEPRTPLERIRVARRELQLAYADLAASPGVRNASASTYVSTALEVCGKATGYLLAAASGHGMRAPGRSDPRREES